MLVLKNPPPPPFSSAFSRQTYKDFLAAIQYAAKSDQATVTVLTGSGTYYSSGQELAIPSSSDSSSSDDPSPSLEDQIRIDVKVTKQLVVELINFPKLLIAAVNGPGDEERSEEE